MTTSITPPGELPNPAPVDVTADAPTSPPAPLTMEKGRWISGWDPENTHQWETQGRKIARRNLNGSIYAEFLGFCVWALWSVAVPMLPEAGFSLTVDQQFWLIAVPSLVGAAMRIPYTFTVPVFGGRNWTIISALLLLIPAIGLAWAVSNPQISFTTLLIIAGLAGFGGGNFASSMTNISFFYPEREKGKALGLNAAGGNLGTGLVQMVVPIVVTAGAGLALNRAGLMFIPLVLIAAIVAWRSMDNLRDVASDPKSFAQAGRHPHTWLISFLYIGTFGSFIGYSGAFPTLLKNEFPEVTLSIAFLGALVGALTRPLGGIIADRVGGARLTVVCFIALAAGALGAIFGLRTGSFALFFASFLVLFAASGIGNGSTYRMIPAVFRTGVAPEHLLTVRQAAAGCIGIAGAVGAIGGFLIPRGFAMSTSMAGSLIPALLVFIGVYLFMAVLTWVLYVRSTSAFAREGV
ncbi:MFS transporter [Jonesia quinghaiensis]|uniref:MFS transporter n=1 Tax=Jonesia quinghaiensis TaxID=262806 RepID=UPI00041D6038